MFDFNNVTIVKKANVYFDGKVTSRTIMFSDDTRKTLGIMMPGEYEFGTSEKEIMEVIKKSSISDWSKKSLALWSLVFDIYPSKEGRFI